MSLSTHIAEEMKLAMKAKDKERLETLRGIKSAIMLAVTEKSKDASLSADEELKILQRLQKQRKDSLEIYQEQGRKDLAEVEEYQLKVIEGFLPKQMDAEELSNYLKGLMNKLNVTSPKDMGKIMGVASKELAGKADGKTISGTIKKLLAGG